MINQFLGQQKYEKNILVISLINSIIVIVGLQFKFKIEQKMRQNNHLKGRLSHRDKQAGEDESWKIKETLYESANQHLKENENLSPLLYYMFLILQHLGLLWFIIHPGLGIFGNVILLPQITIGIKTLNFYEFLQEDPKLIEYLLGSFVIYLVLQTILAMVSFFSVINKGSRKIIKYIRKIVNYQLIFNVKVLSGPIFGLVINIFYCKEDNNFNGGQVCYSGAHLAYCFIAGVIALTTLSQVIFYALFYLIKNPLSPSYMADYSRNYTLSKAFIKLILPVYFAFDSKFTLAIVYCILLTGLWMLYIGFHRILSIHSYNQKHFYLQYYLECFLFWMAANNVISYYIQGPGNSQPLNFVYSLFSSFLIATFMMNFQKTMENKLIEECLEKKIKKQNIQRFVFILIDLFFNYPPKQAKNNFKVYSTMILKIIEHEKEKEKLNLPQKLSQKEEMYKFLLMLVNSYLTECHSVLLKTLRCELLYLLGLRCYGLHQSLELSEQKLGILDEYTVFQFRNSNNMFANEQDNKSLTEFVKTYKISENFGRLEDLVERCKQNNIQYWEQLGQIEPSLIKLQNLANKYHIYYEKIKHQYNQVILLHPTHIASTRLYYHFLTRVGVDNEQTGKIKQIFKSLMATQEASLALPQYDMMRDECLTIMSIDSIGSNIGVVLNCNSFIKQELGYDKKDIIGKNITKLMPKVYNQRHSEWVSNFIKRQQSSALRPITKRIPSLSKQSTLIQLELTYRVISSSQSSLVIVGFLRNLTKYQNISKPQLMYSLNTLQILGINSEFVTLMGGSISGKQVIQQNFKFNSILPQLDISTLKQSASVLTSLQVNKSKGQQSPEKFIKVNVHLKSITTLNDLSIGILVIEQNNSSKIGHQIKNNVERQSHTFSINELARKKSIQPSNPQNQFFSSYGQTESSLSRLSVSNLVLEKQIKDLVANKEKGKMVWLALFIHILVIIGSASLLIFTYTSHDNNLSDLLQMYQQFHQTTTMAYYVSRVNILTSLMWSYQQKQKNSDYINWLPIFNSDYESLKNNFNEVVKASKNHPQNLHYNKVANKQLFKYVIGANQNLLVLNFTSLVNDVFHLYISSASIFTDINMLSQAESQKNLIQIQMSFIRLNGYDSLPNITSTGISLYQKLFNQSIDTQFSFLIWARLGLFFVFMLEIGLVLLIGRSVSQTNELMIKIYQKIRLWDIMELAEKCSHSKSNKNKESYSYLLKIFPYKPLLNIIKSSNSKKQKSHENQLPKLDNFKPTLYDYSESPAPLMSYNPSVLEKAEPREADGEEEPIINGKEVQQKVRLAWKHNNSSKTVIVIMILCIFCGIFTPLMLMNISSSVELKYKVTQLKNIEQIRNTLGYINYLSYRAINNPQDSQVRSKLNQYILKFYNTSGQAYPYLGDPQPFLKKVYTYVETIQQWLSLPNISSTNIMLANFTTIYKGLTEACDEIETLNSNLFQPNYSTYIDFNQQYQFIFTLILILIAFLIVLILHFFYLKPKGKQSMRSINMIKMLPAWIFQRNEEAIQYLIQ